MPIVRPDGTKYAEGCVIREYERNGYHDSDFYARYWDVESESVKTDLFASTRGGCACAYATKADATPEVLELVAAWEKKQAHRRDVRHAWTRRQHNDYLAALLGYTRSQIIRLRTAYPDQNKIVGGSFAAVAFPHDSVEFVACIKLLETRKNDRFRSDFRKSMADQIHCWLKAESKYATPLSPKQISYAPQRDQYILYPHIKE